MSTRWSTWSTSLSLVTVLAAAATAWGAEIPPPADQIHAAVAPAPPERRDAARVLGYDPDGSLIELRGGSGDLVCLADDPGDERFHVACYHASLEPFMARGRELRAQGVERADILSMRRDEIAAGDLAFPAGPAALYSLTGPPGSFDAETQRVLGGNRVYSIYIAGATGETTGLPLEPIADDQPWLMSPGEPWAHIMIVQPSHRDGAEGD